MRFGNASGEWKLGPGVARAVRTTWSFFLRSDAARGRSGEARWRFGKGSAQAREGQAKQEELRSAPFSSPGHDSHLLRCCCGDRFRFCELVAAWILRCTGASFRCGLL